MDIMDMGSVQWTALSRIIAPKQPIVVGYCCGISETLTVQVVDFSSPWLTENVFPTPHGNCYQ